MNAHKNKYGLTPKQENFANEYMRLGSASDAYRSAYNADGMTNATIHVEASKLLNSPKITMRLKTLSGEKEEKQRLESVSLRERIISGLLIEAEGASSDSARVQAWTQLGRTLPNFFAPEKQEVDQKMVVKHAEKDLEKAVTDALADQNVVKLLKSNKK